MNNEREFSILEGVAYAVGAIGIQITSISLVQWLPFFYTPPEGSGKRALITVGQMSIMMLIGRVMDAISDPMIGTLSDRTRSRLGRRRPYILYGNIPLALAFFFLWLPPVYHLSFRNFIYSTAIICIYWWMFTVVLIPLVALLPEMARSDKGRVALGVYWAWGMALGALLSFVLSSLLIEKFGYSFMGLVISLISFFCFLFTGSVIKERYHQEEIAPFSFKDFTSVLENKPFLIFSTSFFLFNLGFYTIQMILPYFNNVVLHGKEGDIALYMGTYLLISLIFANIYQWLTRYFSLKVLYASGLIAFTIVFPFLYWIGISSGHFSQKTLTLLLVALAGIPQAALYVFLGPLLGQVIDLDEEKTGKRREAIYSGVNGFLLKLAMSLSSLVLFLLFKFGYSSKNPTGILLSGPVASLFALIGFLVFLFYPVLDKNRKSDPT